MICAEMKDNNVIGYYLEDFNGTKKCLSILENGGIKIDKELWQYLITLDFPRFLDEKEDKIYTIDDKSLFEKIVQPINNIPQAPSAEERLTALEIALMGVI